MRGIAILGVVLFHLTSVWMAYVRVPLPIPLLGEDALKLFHSTGWGVSLFFLLSGYLLTWTEEKRARSGAYSVRSYALRRVLRLVPAYYFAILVAIAVWPERASVTSVLCTRRSCRPSTRTPGWPWIPSSGPSPPRWSSTSCSPSSS